MQHYVLFFCFPSPHFRDWLWRWVNPFMTAHPQSLLFSNRTLEDCHCSVRAPHSHYSARAPSKRRQEPLPRGGDEKKHAVSISNDNLPCRWSWQKFSWWISIGVGKNIYYIETWWFSNICVRFYNNGIMKRDQMNACRRQSSCNRTPWMGMGQLGGNLASRKQSLKFSWVSTCPDI